MKQLSQTNIALIELLRSAVNDCPTDVSLLRGTDFDAVLKLSDEQSLSALAALGAIRLNGSGLMTPEQEKTWSERKNNSVRRNIMLDAERRRICDAFAARQIPYMLLKGSVMQRYYPVYGTREMADTDILSDESRMADVRDVMVSLGYNVTTYEESHHDTYDKEPIYNVEVHRSLFPANTELFCLYYENVSERLHPTDDSPYAYAFSAEDFYVFLIAHACKHLKEEGGTGLRTLTDILLVCRGEQLDRAYIERELTALDILADELAMRRLAEHIFSAEAMPALSDDERELLQFMLNAGSYGSYEQKIASRIGGISAGSGKAKTSDKLKYLWNRVFLKPELYRYSHPFFYKHKIARPILPFYRAVLGVTTQRSKAKNELNAVKKS